MYGGKFTAKIQIFNECWLYYSAQSGPLLVLQKAIHYNDLIGSCCIPNNGHAGRAINLASRSLY